MKTIILGAHSQALLIYGVITENEICEFYAIKAETKESIIIVWGDKDQW